MQMTFLSGFLLSIFLCHISNGRKPSPEEMRRTMMADWMNTKKYRFDGHTRRERDYLKYCGEKIARYDDDAYYHYDEREQSFRPRAGEVQTRCKKKELRMLTRDELLAWSKSFRDWNTAIVDKDTQRTEQEVFVLNHRYPRAEPAHYGPCFLCWHQIYLMMFEAALQKHNATACPPYWDSRLDQCLTNPHESVLFSKALMGLRHGQVTEGLFANLTLRPADCRKNATEPYLYRDVVNGTEGRYYLYSDALENGMSSKSNNYTQLCYPRYAEFEDNHGYGHMWIGGAMAPLACSPNDPMFWMHHQNIDRQFKFFCRDHPMTSNRQSYYPAWPNVPTPQFYNATLSPFHEFYPGITCGSGLNQEYDLWTMYEEPPIACTKHSDCKSEYLWCHPNCNGRSRCSAKLMEGGKCDGYPIEACYRPSDCAGKNMTCKNLGSGNVCTCS